MHPVAKITRAAGSMAEGALPKAEMAAGRPKQLAPTMVLARLNTSDGIDALPSSTFSPVAPDEATLLCKTMPSGLMGVEDLGTFKRFHGFLIFLEDIDALNACTLATVGSKVGTRSSNHVAVLAFI